MYDANIFIDRNADRFHTIIDRFDNLQKAEDIRTVLHEAATAYGLEHIAYAGFNIPNQKRQTPYLSVTYTDEWVKHYTDRSYIEIDPVISQGMRSILPIDWNDVDRTSKTIRQMFDEAEQAGVGRQGLSIPVRGRNGDRAICCLTANMRDHDWKLLKRHFMRDFQALSVYIHYSVVKSTNTDMKEVPLSKRESQCLYWAACGKTADEIAIILGLTRRGVRFHLSNSLIKLDAVNIAQATSKAIAMELINPPE